MRAAALGGHGVDLDQVFEQRVPLFLGGGEALARLAAQPGLDHHRLGIGVVVEQQGAGGQVEAGLFQGVQCAVLAPGAVVVHSLEEALHAAGEATEEAGEGVKIHRSHWVALAHVSVLHRRAGGWLVELDTGGQRTGVQSPLAALELAQRVADLPGLALQGLMTYPSHVRAKPWTVDTLQRDHHSDAAGYPWRIH